MTSELAGNQAQTAAQEAKASRASAFGSEQSTFVVSLAGSEAA